MWFADLTEATKMGMDEGRGGGGGGGSGSGGGEEDGVVVGGGAGEIQGWSLAGATTDVTRVECGLVWES